MDFFFYSFFFYFLKGNGTETEIVFYFFQHKVRLCNPTNQKKKKLIENKKINRAHSLSFSEIHFYAPHISAAIAFYFFQINYRFQNQLI